MKLKSQRKSVENDHDDDHPKACLASLWPSSADETITAEAAHELLINLTVHLTAPFNFDCDQHDDHEEEDHEGEDGEEEGHEEHEEAEENPNPQFFVENIFHDMLGQSGDKFDKEAVETILEKLRKGNKGKR